MALAAPPWDALCAGLPREALSVIAELLGSSDDSTARAAARRIEDRIGLVLSAESPDGARRLFTALPVFRPEARRREQPNPATYRQVNPRDVKAWFEPSGRFESAMPGYESRPEQARMAEAVTDAFNGCTHAVVEAGTGIGKTLAYLVPAVVWSVVNDVPVIISTNTKNLQEQLFRKDLPLVANLLRSPVRFALVKGRANYLCLSRLENLIERRESELVRSELPALAAAVAWAFQTDEGDIAAFDPGPPPPDSPHGISIRDRLASSGDDCRGRKCPYFQRCFLQKARDRSLGADVVVTNHSVFFSEPEDKPLALPKAAQVIFDEAHNLEQAATASFEREIGPRSLRRLLRRLLHVQARQRAAAKGGKAMGSGLLPDIERLLLSGPVMATPEARDAMIALVNTSRSLCESTARSGMAWFHALSALLRRDESAHRLRPDTLTTTAWKDSETPLKRFQDDLYALSKTISLFCRVFGPRVDAQGQPTPPPRYTPQISGQTAAKNIGAAALSTATTPPRGVSPKPTPFAAVEAPDGVPLELAPFAAVEAPGGGAERMAAAQGVVSGAPVQALAQQVSALHTRLLTADASLAEAIADLDFLSAAADEDWVYWAEPAFAAGRRLAETGIRAAPIEVAEFLANGLFAKRDSVVLCSATMSAGGKTDYLSHRLGLDIIRNADPARIAETRLGSPFDYQRQCLTAVPMFLPESSGPSGAGDTPDAPFPSAFGDLAASLAIEAGGGTLALFTSYRTMRAVAQRMVPALAAAGIELLVQGSGPTREELTARFRDPSNRSMLLGTDSFWEGVDLVGDALRCLIIAKLPFASPEEPIVDARGERVKARGGSAFRDYALPAAAIRLRQGFGRLIRNKTDRGVVVIADTRIVTKSYGAVFRRDLPVEPEKFSDPASLLAAARAFFASNIG